MENCASTLEFIIEQFRLINAYVGFHRDPMLQFRKKQIQERRAYWSSWNGGHVMGVAQTAALCMPLSNRFAIAETAVPVSVVIEKFHEH